MPQVTDLARDVVVFGAAGGITWLWLRWRSDRKRPTLHRHALALRALVPGQGRRAALITNPTKVTDANRLQDRVEDIGAHHGYHLARWEDTTETDPGYGQTTAALEAGADLVLVYGGDGTIRAVASILAGSDTPLALVPAGTGNLLARNLGIPVNDVDTALDLGFSDNQRRIDVAVAEIDRSGEDETPRQETFLVMAGLGFDAEVMASVEPRLKKRMGWFAYVVAGARHIRGRQTKVTLRLDDAPAVHRRVRSVVVGNCGSLTGGIRLLPDARPDDGWLDVVAVSPRGVVGWAAVVASLLSRTRRGHPLVERFRCRSIEVRAQTPLHIQLDGDADGQARVLRVRVEPRALTVRAPVVSEPLSQTMSPDMTGIGPDTDDMTTTEPTQDSPGGPDTTESSLTDSNE